ncbi:MAG: hypothetical protein Q4E50_07075, partial [Tissierellia bacterium]|nr:hypothetical protein [Tissierellia bacterium]
MKKRLTTIIIALALILSLAACGQQATDLDGDKDTQAEAKLFSKGAILVKVNPELKVNYNDQGLTTSVEALNDDGIKILKSLDDFINKEVKDVVRSIIKEIDKKGYLFEEIEGKEREIVLEVEKGSVVPEASFIDDIVATVEDLITKEIASNNLDKKPNLVVKDYDDDKDLDDDNNLDKDRDDDRKDLDDDDKKTTDETIVKTIKTTDKKSTTDKDKKVDSSDKNTSGTIPKAVEHDDDDDDDDN